MSCSTSQLPSEKSFIMTGHALIQHFLQKDEPLVPRVKRHYAISVSCAVLSVLVFNPIESLHALSIRFQKE